MSLSDREVVPAPSNDLAWLLMAFGEVRQYGGNTGYADEITRCYRYDSFVPNHKQLAVGDVVVLQGPRRLLGYAKIQRIETKPELKLLRRCPVEGCGTTGLKIRSTRLPKYRCNNQHEFDVPKEQLVECIAFVAHYEKTFVPEPTVVLADRLREAWLHPRDQAAIRKLSLKRLLSALPQAASVIVEAIARLGASPIEHMSASDAEEPETPGYRPSDGDSRPNVLREIKARRGQRAFRNALRLRYGDQCQVSRNELLELLEAAHIQPYRGDEDNHPDNGLLLRADLHTLFDLDLLGIEPERRLVRLHPLAVEHGFEELDGVELACERGRPSMAALGYRWMTFQQRCRSI